MNAKYQELAEAWRDAAVAYESARAEFERADNRQHVAHIALTEAKDAVTRCVYDDVRGRDDLLNSVTL